MPRRFRGPPDSANGGYLCGRLAAFCGEAARIRLEAPPPLETELSVIQDDQALRLCRDETTLARAWPEGPDWVPPPAPTVDEAVAASRGYAGFESHWFPGCFVCGPERAQGDGLRIFAGPLDEDEGVAAPWQPGDDLDDGHGRVAPVYLWAALDCPGAFSFQPAAGNAVLLGQLSGRIAGAIQLGEPCVVRGWPIAHQGRKHTVGTALYGADGEPRAWAEAVWVEVKS